MTRFIDPDREAFAAFKNLPRGVPVEMLNLVALNERATYADNREATGADAYKAYGSESGPIFKGVGGSIIWSGNPKLMLIGPADETWDVAFIARYPTAGAFLAMVTDPAYQAIVYHRQAAVRTSRLIRMETKDAGVGFG